MSGCPGSQMVDFRAKETSATTSETEAAQAPSELRQWPVQFHLISPQAPYFQNADVVLTADCVAYALANYHGNYLKGKSIAIACPKLDDGQEEYVQKVTQWCDEAKINTLQVMIMQVPCCRGLLQVALEGVKAAKRKVPVKYTIVGLQGEILEEQWAG